MHILSTPPTVTDITSNHNKTQIQQSSDFQNEDEENDVLTSHDYYRYTWRIITQTMVSQCNYTKNDN